MKGKGMLGRSDQEKTEAVFKQLDKCVNEARKAKWSNNWKDAWQEANKLNSLTKCSCTVQIVANSAAVLSGLCQRNWILVFVSVTAIFGFAVVLYGSKHKK